MVDTMSNSTISLMDDKISNNQAENDKRLSENVFHPLNNEWVYWAHLPHDTDWRVESYKKVLDSTTKYERYHLLNHLYSPIFKYEKNIKPAPNPFYTLDKYLGTFTIDEYRKHLCGNDSYFIIVEKPLTKIVPELYEETNINFTNINSGGNLKFKRKNKI